LYELFYPIDNKEFSPKDDSRISSEIAELYGKGWSLREIAREYGCSKTRVRSRLLKEGHEPRDMYAQVTHDRKVSAGKQGALPYFGFCYFDGRIVPDPREFPTLQLIHRRWKERKTIHQITIELNRAKIPSRKGKAWSWVAVQNIVNRFREKKIILHKGGHYEFG
jgi:hypothetical protein